MIALPRLGLGSAARLILPPGNQFGARRRKYAGERAAVPTARTALHRHLVPVLAVIAPIDLGGRA